MTLAEWEESTGVSLTRHKSGAVSFAYAPVLSLSARLNYLLYHLSDYVVSGLAGGSVWLCPREDEKEEKG